MQSTIPAIDFRVGEGPPRRQTVSEVDNALSTVGSFYLNGHGIDQGKIDACFEWSKRLFNLTEREKETFFHTSQLTNLSYIGTGKEIVRGQACMKEGFGFKGLEADALDRWPNEELLPGFRDFIAGFHQDFVQLTRRLLECLSTALDLPAKDSLNQHHTRFSFTSNLLHYPAISAQLLRSGAAVRMSPHSDTGTLTLLFEHSSLSTATASASSGLEVADMSTTTKTTTPAVSQSARFLPAAPPRGAILVLVGRLLMRWSNGRWKNTVHRVVEPSPPPSLQPAHATAATTTTTADESKTMTVPDRYSIAFFSTPDSATVVEPFPSCCFSSGDGDDQSIKKWGPIRVGEWMAAKRAATYPDEGGALNGKLNG